MKTKEADYRIRLHYGFQETESGIYHAFEAADPEDTADNEMIAERLAELLDTDVNDDRFDHSSMLVHLPDSLVERIKADAVKEYRQSLEGAVR